MDYLESIYKNKYIISHGLLGLVRCYSRCPVLEATSVADCQGDFRQLPPVLGPTDDAKA